MGFANDAQRKAIWASKNEKKSPAKVEGLKKVVKQLKGAVKAHGAQAATVQKHIDKMENKSPSKYDTSVNSPAMKKLSASCKSAARAKFDVYPSAYANIWASKQQKAGKC